MIGIFFILITKQGNEPIGCTRKYILRQKKSADKGVSAESGNKRRPLGEKRFLCGKTIGENILRSMLAIKPQYYLVIDYFYIISFKAVFFN